jgi:hypothetical protein
MNRFSSARDLTARVATGGGGMDVRLMFMCGCNGKREPGAMFRGNMPWRCAACVAKKAAA